MKEMEKRKRQYREDLSGKRFHNLIAVCRVENQKGRSSWLCRCDCGNEKIVTARDLKAGKVKSCGCLIHVGHHRVDLTGNRYGRLTVLKPTEKRDYKGSVYWKCRCDCGKEIEATQGVLVSGKKKSCGCLKAENQKNISKQLHLVDGTCVEMLEKRKNRKDNTSGFRGVSRQKDNCYRVDIGFKGRRFYIGAFKNFDEAVSARLHAEEIIHGGFVQEWQKWNVKSAADSEWGRAHPFCYDVTIKDGSITVSKSTYEGD